MAKTKETMIPGKRYKGYGFINEYKEFCFEPEDTGSRAGVIKQIAVREGVSLSETKTLLLIKIKVEKVATRLDLLKSVSNAYNTIVKLLKEYEI